MKKMLYWIDLMMLSLMIVSLPSLEAPKNIFLVGYLLTRTFTEIDQFKRGIRQWSNWDSLFLTIVFTAFLSTWFAGLSGLEEWKGYKVLLTAILTGWFLSRAHYTQENYQNLFKIIVLSAIAPLIWGFYEYLIIHTKSTLQLHSVGHVNHSAIYLVMIFGSSLGWFLSELNFKKEMSGSKWKLIFLGMVSLMFFLGLIIGQSRGAFGVAVMLILSLLFFLGQHKKIKIMGGVGILSILLLIIILKAGIVQKQINNQETHNLLANRNEVWNVSLEAARFSPFLGIGMSNWHFISLERLKKSVEVRGEIFNPKKYFFPGHSHNLYLTALVERGVVGLMMTFLLMIAWIRQLIKTLDLAKKSSEAMYLWAGSFSAWITTFVIGLVNTTFHHEHAILACVLLGLFLSYSNLFFEKKK